MTTSEERERLRGLAAKATARPWDYKPVEFEDGIADDRYPLAGAFITPFTLDCGDYMALHDEDAAYIVAAANLAPALVAEVEALTAELAKTQEWLDESNNVGEALGQTAANFAAEINALKAELARCREANRWIPVGERLPENGQEILALGRNKTVDSWLYYPAVEGVFRLEYTHWRPLPEPPEQP